MLKKYFVICCFLVPGVIAHSQNTRDTVPATEDYRALIDTSLDYTEDMFNELTLFLDSILGPRSYAIAGISVGQGDFNFNNRDNRALKVEKKFIWSPMLGYYDKSGLGITAIGYGINDGHQNNFYQFFVSPSYDYLADRDLATGISYTRYFTKKKLPFYTSPLQNEVNGYFLWRKSWLQPSISLNYGWGSRSDYKTQKIFIDSLRKRALLFTTTEESISDFSMIASLRHDFYWLDIFSHKDYFKFSPLVAFSMGTQKFGFNRTVGVTGLYNTSNVLYSSGIVSLDNHVKLQPISSTLYIRAEYSIGKFFIGPQFLMDYYFPGEEKNFTTLFSVSTGFMF